MNTIQLLNIILIVVLFVILALGGIALIIIYKIRKKKTDTTNQKEIIKSSNNHGIDTSKMITRKGEGIDSIYRFMEFDAIVDRMIVRKKGQQYIMVLECKGINYDLLSEEEKEAVEAGFVAMLNTLRFPIQLYVQTRTLDLRNTIKKYEGRTEEIRDQIRKADYQLKDAMKIGDTNTASKLRAEINRKQNIYEYGKSIEEYTTRISTNKNILQQKTYIVISYYPSEYGDLSKYSREEINDIAFSELYTRSQSVIRALSAAEVTGHVLDSEELAELLYIAYNREGAEALTLRNALDSEYDRLYSTARDVLLEKQKRIEAKIEQDAFKLARNSLVKADAISREERMRRVKERAKQIVDEAKKEISVPLYEETQKQIENADLEVMMNKNAK